MTRPEFERLAGEAVGLIPLRFRRAMRNLALIVEDEPSAAVLAEMGITPPDSLYGLYSGTPLTERTWGDGNRLPDRITLYQRPIEEDAEDAGDAEEVRVIVAETLLHEIGHYFGLSEEEIEEIEEQYWRAHDDGAGEDPA
ncbi:MAG: metallopeptidase family protein [Vicinamibacterales bacterium]